MTDLFSNHGNLRTVISSYFQTDDGPQLVENVFVYLCSNFGVLYSTAITYDSHSHGQAKQYNRAITIRLRLYVDVH